MRYCRAFLPALAAGAGALLLAGSAGAASLIGQTGTGAYYVPDTATVYPLQTVTPATFLIGAGEEQQITIEDVTTVHVDFGAADLALLVNTVLTDPTITSQPFSGLIFTSPGFLTLDGATVGASTTLGGFDNSRVTLSGDQLRLDFAGLSYNDGNLVTLNFTSPVNGTAVPEPATWAIMILGVGGVGAVARRRRMTRAALA